MKALSKSNRRLLLVKMLMLSTILVLMNATDPSLHVTMTDVAQLGLTGGDAGPGVSSE